MDILEKLRILLTGDRAETMLCKKCGKEYKSTGKKDPGVCKECRMIFNGGPLNGLEVGEIRDYTGSETETS